MNELLKPKIDRPRKNRVWVIGEIDPQKTVIIMDCRNGYWQVVRLLNGDVLMAGMDSERFAGDWAKRKGYEVARTIK